jgi:hypothetical protein
MDEPTKVADAAQSQLEATISKGNIKINPELRKAFADEIQKHLALVKQSSVPIMKETIVRSVQNAFAEALAKTKTTLTAAEKETIARDLSTRVSAVSIAKESVSASIGANIKTAEVKDRGSNNSVVRLKISLKEEGLEWTTQASESGGVVRTLQPE